MDFFEELKRRNVYRVGIAYGVVAWLVLQIADLVFQNIDAPGWVIKVLMFLVALGFVAALVIAWAYELTPEGIKREKDVRREDSVTVQTGRKLNAITLAAVVLLMAFMVFDRFVRRPEPGAAPPKTQSTAQPAAPQQASQAAESSKRAAVDQEQSIAVLPFVDMSQEGDQGYFADGITEEILNVLVKTHSLKVAGRTSSFQFRGRNEDLREVGEQLGVENILEGSVRKSGNRLRITAQLVKASDGFHLWSETYDRELTDVFAIQDDIARAITEALAVQLHLRGDTPTLAPVLTSNMAAYDKYLEARDLVARRTDFPRIISLLEEATQLDPQFAAGWATLAQAYALMPYYGARNWGPILQKAGAYAHKAVELGPDSSDAWTALANVQRDSQQWNDAQTSYLRALELNPDDIEANEQFAQMLLRVGHLPDALEHGRRAADLDPLSWVNQTMLGVALWLSGDKEAGWAALNRAGVLADHRRSLVVRFKYRMALSDGMPDAAREAVHQFVINPHPTENIDRQLFIPLVDLLDQPDRARALLRDADTSLDLWANLFWAAWFDDLELADRWMEILASETGRFNEVDGTWTMFPTMEPLFSRPGWKRLMHLNHFDDYWRVHGWPPFCLRCVEE